MEILSISPNRLFSDVAKKQNITHVNFTTFVVGGDLNLKFRTPCITRKYFTNVFGIYYLINILSDKIRNTIPTNML